MRFITLAFLLFVATPAMAEDPVMAFIKDQNTQNLLVLCDSTHPNDRTFCLGYVWGVFRGSDIHPDSVLADGLTFTTLLATVKEALIRQPIYEGQSQRLAPAHLVLLRAWIEAGLITFKPHPVIEG